MNDLRSKLAALFRHCTSPDVSDDEAAVALKEFRSLGATRAEVDAAFGVSDDRTTYTVTKKEPTPAPSNEGPRWPFKKRHAGEPIAHIARTDPDYLRYFLSQEGENALREPLRSQVAAALGISSTTDKPPF